MILVENYYSAGPRCACTAAATLMIATAAACPAGAQSPPSAEPIIREQQPISEPEPEEDKGSIWQRDRLLGDPFGLRSKLESHGITITLQETSEVLGNVTGGIKTGAIYEGATFMALKADTEKLFGLPGGTFNASAWQIHGRGLSANNVLNLNTISSIEATRATRLFELWYEQALLDGALSVRIGQQAADQEFQISTYGGLFINSSFGWPTLDAVDQPGGGPAYPLASLGVRVKAQPTEDLTMMVGVYSGSPS